MSESISFRARWVTLAESCPTTEGLEMLKLISALIAMLVVGAASSCSSSGDQSQSDEPPDPVEVVSGFSQARRAQDVDQALAYVGDSVELDWGPGTTADTLGKGLAWEDAFGIAFTLEDCDPLDRTEAGVGDSVRCTYLVESEVAEAVGNAPGFVCIDFVVQDGLIMRSEMLGSMPGCEYQFNDNVFDPFNAWVREEHPESDPRAMYQDRLSDEGIEIWRRYTAEFLSQDATEALETR
ncbi:MAG: hypothetical protein ACR2NL_07255 [Acidimicrobiia bacterium]